RLSAPTSWNVLTVLTISKTHGLRSVGGHRRCTRRAAGSKTCGLPRSFACLAGSPRALDPTFFLLRADHRQVGLVVERTPWLPAQNGCCRNHITRSAFSKPGNDLSGLLETAPPSQSATKCSFSKREEARVSA